MTYTSTYSLGTARSRFAANTYTRGNQLFSDLAPLTTGGFVVAYGNALDFLGPNYASTHHYVVTDGNVADITAYDNGNVAVLAGDATDDHVQIFDSTGHQVGTTIDVGETGYERSILALHNGNLVVTYSYDGNVYSDLYDPTGHLINTRQVDSSTGHQNAGDANVTVLEDGGYVITYTKFIADYDFDVWGAVFNADGSVRTADHVIVGSGSDSTYDNAATVALDGGGFAMVYTYEDPAVFSNEPQDVVLRTYDAAGVEVGFPRVLAHDDGSDYRTFFYPQIVKLENGFIAVSWLRDLDDGAGADRYLTILDETASPAGLPTNLILAHYDGNIFTYNFGDMSELLSGSLAFARTDPTVDGSGTGVAVTVQELVRTSIGTSGADPFVGDELSDKVYAGGGADLVTGLGGRDFLYGEAGEDFIRGGTDGDYLYGGTENDQVYGDEGDDFVSGDEGNDIIQGDAGNDYVLGGTENDNVSGGDGDDSLFGEAGTDALYGGAGKDRLDGGAGADTLTGGLGDDTYVLAEFHSAGGFPARYVFDTIVEDGGARTGTDTVLVAAIDNKFAPNGYTLGANVENGVVTGTDSFTLTGNRLDNALTGNAAANTLNGGEGFDRLDGGLGDDTFVLADVTTRAGLGTNVYDIVTESVAAGGGIDTVLVQAVGNGGYLLTANVENGTITGNGDFQLEGNALANALIGNRADNRLIGGAGADTLTGGVGKDSFIYQDLVAGTGGGWGTDVITDFQRGTDIISFIRTSEVKAFRDLTITDHNGNALISTGHGDTIELIGVAAADVGPRNFTFVPAAAFPASPFATGDNPAHHWLDSFGGLHFHVAEITALP